jgi:hypothetical protein
MLLKSVGQKCLLRNRFSLGGHGYQALDSAVAFDDIALPHGTGLLRNEPQFDRSHGDQRKSEMFGKSLMNIPHYRIDRRRFSRFGRTLPSSNGSMPS